MSTFGVGIAAGVAQGSVQASQVSRALHRQQTDTSTEARRVRELHSAHIEALDEGDDADLISQVRVDDQTPQHGHPGRDDESKESAKPQVEGEGEGVIASSASVVDQARAADDNVKNRLYRHLDVTG